MRSALEVARLQQRVWSAATLAIAIQEGKEWEYTQVDWEEACTELLATAKQRQQHRQRLAAAAASVGSAASAGGDGSSAAAASAAGHGGINPGSMLWSRVFRQPFMLQVREGELSNANISLNLPPHIPSVLSCFLSVFYSFRCICLYCLLIRYLYYLHYLCYYYHRWSDCYVNPVTRCWEVPEPCYCTRWPLRGSISTEPHWLPPLIQLQRINRTIIIMIVITG